MLIQDMTREMSLSLVQNIRFGRIACVKDSQPYITPLSFAYSDGYLYSFGTVGKRISWMRANPLVCVEVETIASREEWQTVVILGRYQELTDTPDFEETRVIAHDVLATDPDWWNPGYAKTIHQGTERNIEPVYFRISIDEISGHQGVPPR